MSTAALAKAEALGPRKMYCNPSDSEGMSAIARNAAFFVLVMLRACLSRSHEYGEAARNDGAGVPGKCTATRGEAEGMSAIARNGTFFWLICGVTVIASRAVPKRTAAQRRALEARSGGPRKMRAPER